MERSALCVDGRHCDSDQRTKIVEAAPADDLVNEGITTSHFDECTYSRHTVVRRHYYKHIKYVKALTFTTCVRATFSTLM